MATVSLSMSHQIMDLADDLGLDAHLPLRGKEFFFGFTLSACLFEAGFSVQNKSQALGHSKMVAYG
jgi:hypothetical protein